MPTQYTVITTIGTNTFAADRLRKDDHGDFNFYNGSKDTAPVREFVRENTIAVVPEGPA